MELTFEKQDRFYVSEFQITSDANIHIEKSTGKLEFFQRTLGAGDYAEVKDFDTSDYDSDKIIDIDLQSLVYPKWIKIKSAVKPLIATITTDGEVNEVVYQAKEVEITSNGTTKVTADTGYTALASVNVKVNVPTEGGGSSSDNWEYWDTKGMLVNEVAAAFSVLACLVKLPSFIGPAWQAARVGDAPCFMVAIDKSLPFIQEGTTVKTVGEFLDYDIGGGTTMRDALLAMGFSQTTKEAFYDMNL